MRTFLRPTARGCRAHCNAAKLKKHTFARPANLPVNLGSHAHATHLDLRQGPRVMCMIHV